MDEAKPEPIDLSTFGKIRPLTVDGLRHYGSADVDPYTIQLAGQLTDRFHFSQQGQRNLSVAFDSLPAKDYADGNFEIGYGEHHILHTILKHDQGFKTAALVGALSEYFYEDAVVEFFMLLTSKAEVPGAWRSLEHQWKRVASVLYGVLSTSTLGILLSSVEEKLPTAQGSVYLERLLAALDQLSDASRTGMLL